jgi:predicted transcriptional regulator
VRTFAQASRVLGALEERIMEILWSAGEPLAVREVMARLPRRRPLAYTTVMTTLDRLYKKGLLGRDKEGSAFRYRPALTRDEYDRRIVEETVPGLLARSADPVLAAFVDVAARLDEDNLRRLERLIAARRRRRS